MNKVLKISFFSLMLNAALGLISCSKPAIFQKNIPAINEKRSGTQIILGFSQIGSESAWRTRNTDSVFEAANEQGIQVIYDDAQQKQANQLKAIRSFIVYQVDVIAFVPIVEDGWENVLQEAKDARIPVIVVDRKINCDESLYAGFIGENSIEEGRKAAGFLLQKYSSEQYSKKSAINIFEISGTKDSSAAKERAAGFREVISCDKRFKIISVEDGDFLRSKGKEIVSSHIQDSQLMVNGKTVDVIFSHNDAMILGALDAFREQSIETRDKITIVSIDAEQKSIDALKEGKLNCVVECNPNLGPELMKLVKTIANRNTIPRETYMQEQVFTETNDFSLIGPRGY